MATPLIINPLEVFLVIMRRYLLRANEVVKAKTPESIYVQTLNDHISRITRY